MFASKKRTTEHFLRALLRAIPLLGAGNFAVV
jgi:hypothetical protein